MPNKSVYFYEDDLCVAHLLIIAQRNIDSSLITSDFPFGTALFCGIVDIFNRFGYNLIGEFL